MERTLAGEVALVTGSGRGLGYQMALRLAQLGASVALHDISAEASAEFGEFKNLGEVAAKISAQNVKVAAVLGSIGDEGAVNAFVKSAEQQLGPISILVNNAGGDIALRGGKPEPNNSLGIPIEDVRAIFERNLIGTMLVCRAVCPGMIERRRGSVVNIASVGAHMGYPDGVAYGVAKAGIVQFTRSLAAEMRPVGVRVNALSPGPTRSARFLVTRKLDEKMMDEKHVPFERYALPEEIADAVSFLCGPQARFITGQVLRVDGGMQIFPA